MAPPPHSCCVILTLVGLTVACSVIGWVIAYMAATWECPTYNGVECVKNEDECYELSPCYCPQDKYSSYHYYRDDACRDEDPKWSSDEEGLFIHFFVLSFSFLIASIVCCICRCCQADDISRFPQYAVIAPGPYPQGGLQYAAAAPGPYPQGGPQYAAAAPWSYPQGGPPYGATAPEPYPKGAKV